MKNKVLIIEDDENTLKMESLLLARAGFETIEANNVKQGIELAFKELPDIIIMDIRLPYKKRGIGAAKIIRNNPATQKIPIVFVTAYQLWENSSEISNISNHGYITKPIDAKNFAETIKKYL